MTCPPLSARGALTAAALAVLGLSACSRPGPGAQNLAAPVNAAAPQEGLAQGAAENPQAPEQTTQDYAAPAAGPAQGVPGDAYAAPPPEGYGAPADMADSPPPPIPQYEQPPPPSDGYVWTPGYWVWNVAVARYDWTPGLWARPPRSGLLWTPGYWCYQHGRYGFIPGYWAERVGFYGGVNYGFGYGGHGYDGGRWQGGRFFYNAAANNVGRLPGEFVYRAEVRQAGPRLGFSGGPAGIQAAPGPEDLAATRAPHYGPTAEQIGRQQTFQGAPGPRPGFAHTRPAISGDSRPGVHPGGGADGGRHGQVYGSVPAPAPVPAAAVPETRPGPFGSTYQPPPQSAPAPERSAQSVRPPSALAQPPIVQSPPSGQGHPPIVQPPQSGPPRRPPGQPFATAPRREAPPRAGDHPQTDYGQGGIFRANPGQGQPRGQPQP
jgi:hypothetical protein